MGTNISISNTHIYSIGLKIMIYNIVQRNYDFFQGKYGTNSVDTSTDK